MINKRQWRNTFKVNDDLDKSFKLLYGVTNPAGCAVCGNDSFDDLGIHKVDDRPGLQVLCGDCHDKIIKNACFSSAKYNATQDGATL